MKAKPKKKTKRETLIDGIESQAIVHMSDEVRLALQVLPLNRLSYVAEYFSEVRSQGVADGRSEGRSEAKFEEGYTETCGACGR